ncbi:serine/threonine-protein kinase pim-1 [Silurus meridionalis]|nr:serine/threonine-protein kinase pim-1 [Silurus meridionalis]
MKEYIKRVPYIFINALNALKLLGIKNSLLECGDPKTQHQGSNQTNLTKSSFRGKRKSAHLAGKNEPQQKRPRKQTQNNPVLANSPKVAVNNNKHSGFCNKKKTYIKRVSYLNLRTLKLLGIKESLFREQFTDAKAQHQGSNQTDLSSARGKRQVKSSSRSKRKSAHLPDENEPQQKRSRTQLTQDNHDLADSPKLAVNNNQHSGCLNVKKSAYIKCVSKSCLCVPKLLRTKEKSLSQEQVADPRAQHQWSNQTDLPKSSARGKRKTTNLLDENECEQRNTRTQITHENPDLLNSSKLPSKHVGTANFKNEYEEGELLGKGGFGCVFTGIRKADGLPVAIKYVSKQESPEELEIPGHGYLPTEVALMSIVNTEPFCSNILRILEWYDDHDKYIMILERPEPCEDLDQFRKKHGSRLPEFMARKLMFQLLKALKHCKSRGILHRDIKPENILVQTDTLNIKLFDFGCGDLVKDCYNEFAGTFDYAPPEWYKKKQYLADPATAWTVGMTLYKLVCGSLPFKTRNQLKRGFVHFPKNMSQECSHLIRWCLRVKAENRPSLEQIEHHQWFHLSGICSVLLLPLSL